MNLLHWYNLMNSRDSRKCYFTMVHSSSKGFSPQIPHRPPKSFASGGAFRLRHSTTQTTTGPTTRSRSQHGCPPPCIHGKKGNRIAFPTSNLLRSSKRMSKGEEIMEDLTRNFYEIRDQSESTMIKSSTSSSVANVPNTDCPRDWLIEAINIINTLAGEMAMPTRAHRKACEALMGKNVAKVFVLMTDACRKDWLMDFLSPDFK